MNHMATIKLLQMRAFTFRMNDGARERFGRGKNGERIKREQTQTLHIHSTRNTNNVRKLNASNRNEYV